MKMRIMAAMVAMCLMMVGNARAQLRDNGNGTITDTAQGVAWLKDASCLGRLDWESARNSASGLHSGMCGLTDKSTAGQWRLPTRGELLARFGNTAGFPFVPPQYYWSSDIDTTNVNNAWFVSMYSGRAGTATKIFPQNVWAVRNAR